MKDGDDPLSEAKLSLAEYIADGDFSEVLGAGLGAVYSLLPSKLVVRSEAKENDAAATGMILGGLRTVKGRDDGGGEAEDDDEGDEGDGVSTSQNFRSLLDGLLKLLEFIQDVIRRISTTSPSPSADETSIFSQTLSSTPSPQALLGLSMRSSILAATRSTFLEHVLYPSILECSDLDGSAVAVISYIDVMLSTLESRAGLGALVLNFLMGEDETEGGKDRGVDVGRESLRARDGRRMDRGKRIQVAKHSRRKSSAVCVTSIGPYFRLCSYLY